MFVPDEFLMPSTELPWQLAEERRFGCLVVALAAQAPMTVHLPLMFDARAGRVIGHVAARNPVVAAVDQGARALVVMQCADAYISPRWYGCEPDVPTWNYVAVEFEGALRRLAHPEALALLTASAVAFEHAAGLPAPAWTHTEMPDPGLAEHLARAIVGFELQVDRVTGAAKLSQDKVADDLMAVQSALCSSPRDSARALARLMSRLAPGPRDVATVPSTMPPGYQPPDPAQP